ncbi:LacI family DNA-binding transcriptional regulator, partial [Streptomyces sp. NPDC057557]|uniref:LacI family DNA-binding transcriptional regulator n=1 Tax=Streptomyces sp. NPDC057557 TaxID=3346167 RepID=UPI0036AB5256
MVDGVTVPLPRGPGTGGAPRLSDIAGQAAVSEATVSRVLNGKPGVADTTRQRVLAALDVLGYERPVRLRQRSAGLIGLVTPELTNPIFPAFAQSVEQVLAGHGYTPVLCTQLPGGATEDELVEQLVERGVGGIVFLSGLHADMSADPARGGGGGPPPARALAARQIENLYTISPALSPHRARRAL